MNEVYVAYLRRSEGYAGGHGVAGGYIGFEGDFEGLWSVK